MSYAPETKMIPAMLNKMERILMLLNVSLWTMRLRIAVIAGEENAITVATAAPLY
jgi:hypothetical protein